MKGKGEVDCMSTKNRSLISKVVPFFERISLFIIVRVRLLIFALLLFLYSLIVIETYLSHYQYSFCRLVSVAVSDAFAYREKNCNNVECIYEPNEECLLYDATNNYERCSCDVGYVVKEYSAYHASLNWIRTTLWPLFFYLPNSSSSNVYFYINERIADSPEYYSIVVNAITNPLKYLSSFECIDMDSSAYGLYHEMWRYAELIKGEEYRVDLVSGPISTVNSGTEFNFIFLRSFDVSI